MSLLSVFVAILVVVVTLVVTYVVYMSRFFGPFQRMGFKGPKPLPGLGNVPEMLKEGFAAFYNRIYNEYENEKVVIVHEPGRPFLMVRDLDMIRDISIKHFNSFVNRRVFLSAEPFSHVMTNLKDDHWRRVRNFVSPAFSSGKLKRMSHHVDETAQRLMTNLRQYCKESKDVELKNIMSYYSMDVIASTGFGVEIESLKDKDSPFVTQATKIILGFGAKLIAFSMFLPFLVKLVISMGIRVFPLDASRFFFKFVDEAMVNRSKDESSAKRYDFLQIMIDAAETPLLTDSSELKVDVSDKKVGMSRDDIMGQSLIFIIASYDNISTVVSFALFLLAHHPECCRKAQEEIDSVLGSTATTTAGGDGGDGGNGDGESSVMTYENVHELTYLDMLVNETIRLYPPGFLFDRQCNEDCTVQGVHIPKGTYIMFPAMAIHHDAKYWPEPEHFDPERFSTEQKADRHPFAHLPFGQGPRNCVGMRLALVQVKFALASVLREMTPVPCDKSVYPPVVDKFKMRAKDELWVKLKLRED